MHKISTEKFSAVVNLKPLKKNCFQYCVVFVLYLLVSLLFLYPLLESKVLIVMDNLLHISPVYSLWKTEVLAGRIPLWNPYVFAGLPFIGDTSHPIFNPGNILFLLIPNLFQATSIQILILLAVNGLGAFHLGRTFGFSTKIAWLCGLSVGVSGTVFHDINDMNSLYALCFMPWTLAAYFVFLKKRNIKSKVSLILISSLMVFTSHSQYVYYICLGMAMIGVEHLIVNGLYRDKKQLISYIVDQMIVGGFILLISGVVILPTLEFMKYVDRSSAISHHQIHSERLITLVRNIMPTIFGKQNAGTSWGPGAPLEFGLAGTHGFINISMLVWALVAMLTSRKEPYVKSFMIIAISTLVLSLGQSTPFYDLAGKTIPGWAFFRSPARILSLYTLAIVMLSGIGLSQITKRNIRLLKYFQTCCAVITVFGVASFVMWIAKPNVLALMISWIYQIVKHTPITASVSYSSDKLNVISSMLLQAMAILGLGLLPFKLSHLAFTKNIKIIILITGILVTESFLNIRGNLVFAPKSKINFDPEVVNYLKSHLDGQRYISTSDTESYTGMWHYYFHLYVRPPFSSTLITESELKSWDRFADEISMIPVNLNMTVPLRSSAGYVALLPNNYREYFNSDQSLNRIDFGSYAHPGLSDLATKYIVTGIPEDMLQHDTSGQYTEAFRTDSQAIYRNLSAKLRAELVDTKGHHLSSVKLIDTNPQRVEIISNSTESAKLVLRDLNYPGWTAIVDGVPTQIKTYDKLFRSVDLGAGEHQIVFSFQPMSFYVGLIFSLFGLSGLWLYAKKNLGINDQKL